MLPFKNLKPSSLPPRFDHPELDRLANEWRRLNAGADEAQARVADAHRAVEEEQQVHWRYGISSTLLRGPGCYAFQVDGTNFSGVIVFAATQ